MSELSLVSTAVLEYLKELRASPMDYRCSCGRKLGRGRLIVGSLWETRCPKCGKLVRIDGLPKNGASR